MVRIATAIDEPILLFDAYIQRISRLDLRRRSRNLRRQHRRRGSARRASFADPSSRLAPRACAPRKRSSRAGSTTPSRQIAAIGEYVAAHGLVEQNAVATMTFQLYYERGRLAELEPLLAQMVADNPLIVAWRVALLTVYTATDRFDDAREHLRALAADDFAMVPRDNLWVPAMMGIASAAGDAGELDIAERAYNYMLPFRGIIILTGQSAVLPAGLSLGIAAAALGRFDDARGAATPKGSISPSGSARQRSSPRAGRAGPRRSSMRTGPTTWRAPRSSPGKRSRPPRSSGSAAPSSSAAAFSPPERVNRRE